MDEIKKQKVKLLTSFIFLPKTINVNFEPVIRSVSKWLTDHVIDFAGRQGVFTYLTKLHGPIRFWAMHARLSVN